MFKNLAAARHGIPQFIIDRQFGHFEKVGRAYAKGLRDALPGMDEAHESHETEKHMDRMALEPTK